MDHLSNSQLEMYAKCGEQYRRAYIEKDREPPGIALHVGRACHAGIETNFSQKIESHKDLKVSHIRDAAVASLEEGIEQDGISLDGDESAESTIGRAIDETARVASHHGVEVAPEYQPTHVEEWVKLEIPKLETSLVGVIDLVDDKARVTDFKTARRSYNGSEAAESVQLTIYSLLHQKLTGAAPESVRLDVSAIGKDEIKRQVLESKRTPLDVEILARRIQSMMSGINAGVFPPAPVGAWYCSPKWCGFWHSCPYVNSERIEKEIQANGK